MRYERVVIACVVLLGCAYAARLFHPDICHVVRENVIPPETMIGAVTNLGCMGAALGMFLSLGCAPPAFLGSEVGQWWVKAIGRGGGVTLFRIEMLELAAFLLFVTAVLLDFAFLPQ